MSADLFISYAWTSPDHREWVRLLASQLHLLGYDVRIDEKVDYGSSLTGFMRDVTSARHVLLVVDENYVHRADNLPMSGVGIETRWISDAYEHRPPNWLSVVFVRNPERRLPAWLADQLPKGFDFNASPEEGEFPGSAQIDALWRWIEDLPASKANSVPLETVRKRASRMERIEALRDPGNYASPALRGRVAFRHGDHKHYTIGHGDFEFKISFSGCGDDSVYVYTDGGLKAVGIIYDEEYSTDDIERYLTPGRVVSPCVGQNVALMNKHGALAVITIAAVQRERNTAPYLPAQVDFIYEVLES